MRNRIAVLFVTLALAMSSFAAPSPKVATAKKHAGFKVLSVLVAPVVHPKRTVKQILGSVLFATEPAVDVAHLAFAGLDSAFAANIKPYEPIHYLALGAGRLDSGFEKGELFFFGSHN